mmetsp:Transcript_23564/g.51579  ORF Transcript_23564/g.51579 Transcript_23564/m.51579 type:complete len:167 (+) Transcript_23564:57-557(+)
MVSDLRPQAYPAKELEELQKKMDELAEKEAGPAPGVASSSTVFSGQTLSGGPVASEVGQAPAAGAGADPALLAIATGPAPAVDESKPTTTLQLRLASGARVKVKLNLDHTIADLWRVVAAEMGAAAFQAASNHELVAGFPPKPLADASATLQMADLAGAAVTHRCR